MTLSVGWMKKATATFISHAITFALARAGSLAKTQLLTFPTNSQTNKRETSRNLIFADELRPAALHAQSHGRA